MSYFAENTRTLHCRRNSSHAITHRLFILLPLRVVMFIYFNCFLAITPILHPPPFCVPNVIRFWRPGLSILFSAFHLICFFCAFYFIFFLLDIVFLFLSICTSVYVSTLHNITCAREQPSLCTPERLGISSPILFRKRLLFIEVNPKHFVHLREACANAQFHVEPKPQKFQTFAVAGRLTLHLTEDFSWSDSHSELPSDGYATNCFFFS